MMRLIAALAMVLALCGCGRATPAAAPAPPGPFQFTEAQRAHRYFADFERWAAEDEGRVPLRDGVLCVGSSSMRGWKDIAADLEPLEVIHRGFGGSTMRDVLAFADFFARYEAGTVLVYEGDNDLTSEAMTPEAYAGECREFAAAMWARRPDARIWFISVKPSPSRWGLQPRFERANALVAEWCAGDRRLGFIDVATPMLGPDGRPRAEIFLGDELHMNALGYRIWRRAVRAALLGDAGTEAGG